MLNYLRATTGGFGVSVPTDPVFHHLLAFADDCTGILKDLADAPLFVGNVGTYAKAAGLKLNVSKTKVLPFTACDPALRVSLQHQGFTVVADYEPTVLLGIAQSPCLPACHRYDRSFPRMVTRCQLWRYRARTLRGRAVILRTIVLPLLWYTAAVTSLPTLVASQVTRLCKSFF
uniref:Reverse transcriptase domain-containing protein n=1 Tax=Peronospora matthiolae TaxID=2874970 RepID=A0AAV1V5R3_9STRA